MLIFDRFPDRQSAENFARAVTGRTRKEAWVWDDQDAMNDAYPLRLSPPIVTVERVYWDRPVSEEDGAVEEWIESAVKRFGGQFAGT